MINDLYNIAFLILGIATAVSIIKGFDE